MKIVDTFCSPLGVLHLCSDGSHLTAIAFEGQKYAQRHIPADAKPGQCPVLEQTKQWLSQYFSGQQPGFLPPMRPEGTDFQRMIWDMLLQISYGSTVTYGELAKVYTQKTGQPMFAQAVGGAVGRNPISILIPCHRVLGAGGSLTGYAGGTWRKEALLKLESK